ncbi:MAG: hypothetical protein EXS14_10635 [Planctomycetes bacterium]|nr:hypothetical protein [Planctomycetota bacterium]
MKRLAASVCFFMCAACTASVEQEQDYMLRPPLLPAPTEIAHGAPSLAIASPSVAEHIEGITLVRMDGRVDHLHWSRFATPVGQMVADWMTELINASGKVRFALPPGVQGQTDLTLKLRVARFELEETPPEAGGLRSAVLLEASLLRGSGREVLWTTRKQGGAVAAGSTPAQLIAALGEALRQAAESLNQELQSILPGFSSAPTKN